jgi:alpha-glucosidase (family GH31 glycosyl hydrolase)
MAHLSARSGMPIMRAMPLEFPDDPRSDGLVQQYLFGSSFLTSAFVDSIYLPAGRWTDYWTGTEHQGPLTLPCAPGRDLPQGRGGPLYVRAGSIVPTWPPMQYVGQRSLEELGLEVYANEPGRFVLYEDDGASYEYLQGRVASTAIRCEPAPGSLTLAIAPRQGSYAGMPERRRFRCEIHLQFSPHEVLVDGEADAQRRALTLVVSEDPERGRERLVRVR